MFQTNDLNLGRIAVGETATAKYHYGDSPIDITKMTSDCDCTVINNIGKERAIVVKYTPKPIPYHLAIEGIKEIRIHKEMEVEFTLDGIPQKTTLTFYAIVYAKD